MTVASLGSSRQIFYTTIKAIERRMGKFQKLFANGSGHNASGLPFKQRAAKCIFHFLQHAGEGGLRHIEYLGSSMQVLAVTQGHQHVQMSIL